MVTEKLSLQQKIRDRLGDGQIEARQQSLCQRCISFHHQHCKHGLLPVTSEGSDCPYHHERKDDDTGPEDMGTFWSRGDGITAIVDRVSSSS